jgi:PAS domain S-box-containing protein
VDSTIGVGDAGAGGLEVTVSPRSSPDAPVVIELDTEAAARDQAMLDAVFAGSPVGVGLFDTNLRYVRVNPILREIIGLPEHLLIGRTIAEAMPGFGDSVICHMRRALETGEPARDLELWGRTPASDAVRCFGATYFRLQDGAGATIGLASVVIDITDRKRAQGVADAATERLTLLSRAGRLLGSSLDAELTLAALADLTVPAFADHCVVDLALPGGAFRRTALVHAPGVPPGGGAWRGARGTLTYPAAHPVARVARTGEPMLVSDIDDALIDRAAPTADSAAWGHAIGLVSAIVVPLVVGGAVLGTLSFATSVSGRRYEVADLDLALDLAARTAVALDNAERYQQEHNVAVTLQRSLLPQRLADAPGLRTESAYLPGATEATVGGDWFDVIPLADGRTAIVIGDVMGRGVRAAAVMGQLRAVVRSCATLGLAPGALLGHLDELVQALDADQIVTCVYGVYDPATSTVRLANAGHLRPLLLADGACVDVDVAPGAPLGTGIDDYVEHELALAPDAALVLYTDGLVERRDAHIDDGIDAVRAGLRDIAPDRSVCAAALTAAGVDTQKDDIAILVIRPSPDDPRAAGMEVTFGASAGAARAAREAVAAALTTWAAADRVDAATLVTSELVTNAIHHARTPVTVRLRVDGDRVRLEVLDGDPRLPAEPVAGAGEEAGRGLRLVSAIATSWGAYPTRHGKVVWAEL